MLLFVFFTRYKNLSWLFGTVEYLLYLSKSRTQFDKMRFPKYIIFHQNLHNCNNHKLWFLLVSRKWLVITCKAKNFIRRSKNQIFKSVPPQPQKFSRHSKLCGPQILLGVNPIKSSFQYSRKSSYHKFKRTTQKHNQRGLNLVSEISHTE